MLINSDGRCGWYQPTGGLTGQVDWLGFRVGSHLALTLHSSNEPGNLSQWPRHDDSTMNVVISISIIGPHRSTAYIYAAYCYRLRGMAGLSVWRTSEPCKKAEPIKVLFGLRTQVGPRNRILDGVHISPWKGAILRGEGRHVVKYRDTMVICCTNGWTDHLGYGLGWAQGIMY